MGQHIYIAIDNTLHSLSDEDVTNGGLSLIPQGCIEITEDEAEEIRAVSPDPNDAIMRRLLRLKRSRLQGVCAKQF